jgi:hypothetical protein
LDAIWYSVGRRRRPGTIKGNEPPTTPKEGLDTFPIKGGNPEFSATILALTLVLVTKVTHTHTPQQKRDARTKSKRDTPTTTEMHHSKRERQKTKKGR